VNKTILVTGGAGYIGRATCAALLEAGLEPLVLDKAAKGSGDLVRDLLHPKALEGLQGVSGVIHLAAHSNVAASMTDPATYAKNIDMCRRLQAFSVGLPAVLASSAAVYGHGSSLNEGAAPAPISPYGWSKLASEAALPHATALRYFNVIGGDDAPESGHIVPRAVEAGQTGRALRVHTFDAVRDYVDVHDVARANVLALQALLAGGAPVTLNICAGTGLKTGEVIDAVSATLGVPVPTEEAPPRPGDPRTIVGDPRLARAVLNWKAGRDLTHSIESAVGARQKMAA